VRRRLSMEMLSVPDPRHHTGDRLPLLAILAALIGLVAGGVAWVLYSLIAFVTNATFYHRVSFVLVGIQHHVLGAWVIVVPAIGGLIVGVMAKYGSDKIRGHGIPEAMEAVLVNRSRIAPRVAILKPISAAIAIGTGGPFGAEGPIIQTGGALGSLLGQVLHTTAAERKVLLACGAAAGMAATFSTPIAAVILAIELLLFEFKSRSFIPLVIASTLATTVHIALMGPGPMFTVGAMDFGLPQGLPYYTLLAVICGFAAVLFTRMLYWFEDQFERLPIDEMWWPAIGAVGLGIIAFFVPRVLGVGYDTISDILNARLALGVLLTIAVFKALALFISLGSGTSGGLLAPMFMVGAAIGAAFAMIMNTIYPAAHLSPGAYALVAMAAIFGAASRATFTFVIFAFELTRDYNAILPLMLACVIADGIAMAFTRNSIMTEKLARRGLRVPQEYEADVLQQVNVRDVMDPCPPTVPASMSALDLAKKIAQGVIAADTVIPIVDEKGALAGVISRGDLLRATELEQDGLATVLDAGSNAAVVTYPDELLHDAVVKMLRENVSGLPVVEGEGSRALVGYVGREAVLEARAYRMHQEHVREPGWWRVPRAMPRAGSNTLGAASPDDDGAGGLST
jgi:CIC family chloride channel protein